MIATIATVCLAASAANPQATSHKEGRQLIGYTQSLGERCDMISYCKSGLTCNNGVFGTGKCVTNSEARQQNRNEAARQGYGRQLIGWTHGWVKHVSFRDMVRIRNPCVSINELCIQ
jgi:hypothetical protein